MNHIPKDPIKIRQLLEEVDQNEDEEYYLNLCDAFKPYQMDAYPIPQCCHEQRTWPTIYWTLDCFEEKMSNEQTGSWKCGSLSWEMNSHYMSKHKDHIKYMDDRPDPKCCNYCGEKLPKLVKKKEFPKFTHVGDGYYCQTCGERNIGCHCFPPEYAWQLEERQAACAVLIKDGKILAVSRKEDPTKFGLPGGKSDPGETPEETCLRELEEETGIKGQIWRHIWTGFPDPVHKTHCFLVGFSHESGSPEGLKVEWKTPAEMLLNTSFEKYNRKVLTLLELI